MNRKRALRERRLLVRARHLRARRKNEWGRVEAAEPNQIWQADMTKIWAGPGMGWAYLVCVIDCCTREIGAWKLSHNGTHFTSSRSMETLARLSITLRRKAYYHPEGDSYI